MFLQPERPSESRMIEENGFLTATRLNPSLPVLTLIFSILTGQLTIYGKN